MSRSKLAEAAAKAGIGFAAAGAPGAGLAVLPQAAGGVVEWLFGRPELAGADEAWRDQLRHEVRVFYEEREQRFRAEVQEHLRRTNEVVTALEGRMTEAQRAAAAYPTIEEVAVLAQHFAEEARRSVLDERVTMLAAALAGSFRPDVTKEMRSRVGRAIVRLEPSDVLHLRLLVRHHLGPSGEARHLRGPVDNMEALITAGCLQLASFANGSATIEISNGERHWLGTVLLTDLGRAVLVFLEAYKPEDPPLGK